ncbi:MAG: TIGR03915 family putative DNA repair protein [Oscillospiraceae bacterium]|nr:TIGR03915 family putative DNA repair protein [Oscillospiraceae bacterium]
MSETQKVVYIYDGSFEGFLCCVYNFYYNRLKPVNIVSQADYSPSFYENVMIDTDYEQVYKVRFAIEEKIGRQNFEFLNDCFLSCLENKEMHMLGFIVKGFKMGYKVREMLSDNDVMALFKAHRSLQREVQLYLGLIRFYKAGDIYVSKIEPKNQILPLITWHFINRFANQRFMIYDAANGQALIYANGNHRIVYVDDIRMPQMDTDEKQLQRLWKNFYDTIAIKERYNPKCRMNFMPKRVWNNLPEMNDDKSLSAAPKKY